MSPFKFRLFLLTKVPMAFLAGLRLQLLNDSQAKVSVKYRWLNTNPFKSMYFAVLAMAAEISTGILCFHYLNKQKQSIASLVTHQSGEFTKKAVGKISFNCQEGSLLKDALEQTIKTGEAQIVKLKTIGTDQKGDVVASFEFTWSFKLRSKK